VTTCCAVVHLELHNPNLFELKTDAPVAAALRNFHANFAFPAPFYVGGRSMYGMDGWTGPSGRSHCSSSQFVINEQQIVSSLSRQQLQCLVCCSVKGKKGKVAYCSLWIENPPLSYGASHAVWDHTVLPAIRHRWTRPTLTPAMQAGTRFTYPGGMEGWVDFGVGFIPRWFTCPQRVTHPSRNHLIATRPGVEPTTSRSRVQRPNHYTTKSPVLLSFSWLYKLR